MVLRALCAVHGAVSGSAHNHGMNDTSSTPDRTIRRIVGITFVPGYPAGRFRV